MGNAFFVVWRESLEAFLIAGILYAWLQGNDPSGKGKRALFIGLAAGVGLALLLGWALLTVQDELSGNALEVFQTGTLLVAAGLITQMVLWMRKNGRQMKARLHADLSAAAEKSGFVGVAVVAALAVAREGAETVIFLYGMAQSGDYSAPDRRRAGRFRRRRRHRLAGGEEPGPPQHRPAAAPLFHPAAGARLGPVRRRHRPPDRRRLADADARSGLGHLAADRRFDEGRQAARRFLRLPRPPGADHAARLGRLLDRRLHRLAEKRPWLNIPCISMRSAVATIETKAGPRVDSKKSAFSCAATGA